jgi:hypothetical protein
LHYLPSDITCDKVLHHEIARLGDPHHSLPSHARLAGSGSAAKVKQNTSVMDARTLLEAGQVSGVWPEGMVVRIGACLGESDVQAAGGQVPDELRERWEFTSNQVHRVVIEDDKEKKQSHPFDSKGICKDLLEGKAIEIQARKGTGPKVVLLGTTYRRGSRSIEVVCKGEIILDLHETNGPAFDAYRETDARAFGALYERLASQARAAFKPKAAEAK